MNSALKLFSALLIAALLTACGGGSDAPSDKYAGNWKSSCFPYVAVNNKTYYQTTIVGFSKTSPNSLNMSFSNTLAHSDSSCKNVLGEISNRADATVQIGEKAHVLGGEVDKITYSAAGETRPGYMTANATQFFLIFTITPDQIPHGWGLGSPHTKIGLKHSDRSSSVKNAEANKHFAPVDSLDAYSK